MDYKNIKFRAWHKEQKKMFEVLVLDMNSGEVFLDGLTVSTVYKGQTQQESTWVSVDEVELMMCTGQQDKHGNDIYEGDIVQTDDGVRLHYYNLTVETKYTNTREIIGNIYENPELV